VLPPVLGASLHLTISATLNFRDDAPDAPVVVPISNGLVRPYSRQDLHGQFRQQLCGGGDADPRMPRGASGGPLATAGNRASPTAQGA